MGYTLHINKNTNPGTTFQNVSDFIVGISEIPYVLRNEDYVIIEDSINIKQSYSYTSHQFDKGDDVLIYSNSLVIYSGVIKEKTSDIENRLYSYNVQPRLIYELSKIMYSYEEMNDFIVPYAKDHYLYNLNNTYNRQFIKANNLINAIFDRIGYNLNWNYYTTESFNNCLLLLQSVEEYGNQGDPNYGWFTTFQKTVTSSVSHDDVYFYVPQTYCANQDLIWTNDQITADEKLNSKRITLYDMLSLVSSLFGHALITSSSNGYYVSNVRTPMVRNANDEEYFTTKKIDKLENGLNLSFVSFGELGGSNNTYNTYPFMKYQFHPPLQPYVNPYTTGLPGKVVEEYSEIGTDQKTIDWYSHLLPWHIYTGSWYDGSTTIESPVADILMPYINQKETVLRNKFVMYLGTNYYEEFEIPVAADQRTTVSEHYINLQNDRAPYSKIKNNYLIYEGL